MRLSYLRQRQDRVDYRMQDPVEYEAHDFLEFAAIRHAGANDLELLPKNLWDVRFAFGARGRAVCHQATAPREHTQILFPECLADRVENYIHAAFVGILPKLLRVIDA